MIGIDTNILVRYIVQDNATQSADTRTFNKKAGRMKKHRLVKS